MNMTERILEVVLGVYLAFIMIAVAVGLSHKLEVTDSSPKVEVWQYQGHDMLRYEYKGEISVCHSPECRKCIQVYD